MPKYTFECEGCQTQFARTLKMGEHPTHPCPSCQGPAPRVWMGQGFGFDFATPATSAPANTGVTKHDYPTGDQIVGSHADARWGVYNEREKVKTQVREAGGSRTLVRRMGKDYVEYQAGSEKTIETRKKLVKDGVLAAPPKDGSSKGAQ